MQVLILAWGFAVFEPTVSSNIPIKMPAEPCDVWPEMFPSGISRVPLKKRCHIEVFSKFAKIPLYGGDGWGVLVYELGATKSLRK